jgi:hypothetical protein
VAEFLDRPTIFDALRAQKGPVEYYVTDHVEKPEGN